MRRVDRRTNALQTDQPTNRPTDTASYRGALSHLKTSVILIVFRNWNIIGYLRTLQQLTCDDRRQHFVQQRFGFEFFRCQLFRPTRNFTFQITRIALQKVEDVLDDVTIAARSAALWVLRVWGREEDLVQCASAPFSMNQDLPNHTCRKEMIYSFGSHF